MPKTLSAQSRTKKIKVLLFDVDGVLTDGKLFFFPAPAGAPQTTEEHTAKPRIPKFRLAGLGLGQKLIAKS